MSFGPNHTFYRNFIKFLFLDKWPLDTKLKQKKVTVKVSFKTVGFCRRLQQNFVHFASTKLNEISSKSFFMGEGKTSFMFSVMFPLIFCLACYQQAGRVGQAETERKYVGVSGKHIRYFTLPPFLYVTVRNFQSVSHLPQIFIKF